MGRNGRDCGRTPFSGFPIWRVKAPAVLFLPVSSLLLQEAVLSVQKMKNNAIMPNSIEQNNLFLF
jgi:hypothetical protein